jgi:hypothetical protein
MLLSPQSHGESPHPRPDPTSSEPCDAARRNSLSISVLKLSKTLPLPSICPRCTQAESHACREKQTSDSEPNAALPEGGGELLRQIAEPRGWRPVGWLLAAPQQCRSLQKLQFAGRLPSSSPRPSHGSSTCATVNRFPPEIQRASARHHPSDCGCCYGTSTCCLATAGGEQHD